ncbi:MAG TPA: DUF2946 domain-containing protein, partial [Burkholderiaceae bacterium]
MKLHRVQRAVTAWIAAMAILLASLVPALSHAAAAARTSGAPGLGSTLVEICTVGGTKLVAIDADSGKPAAPQFLAFEHCPFCTLDHAQAVLPAAPPQVAPRAITVRALPPLFYQARTGLHVWSSAQARAPPTAV